MFRTVWSKTLRDYRLPLLNWGIGMALIIAAVYATISQQSGQSATSLNQIMQSFRFLGDPVSVSTPGGFVYIKVLDHTVPIAITVWALLAGARMVRGEEERNSIDLLLATPISRTRLLIEKLIALLLALIGIGLLISVGIVGGEQAAKVPVDAGRALLAGLNVSLYAFLYGSIALFLSQFFLSRGTAAGITSGILAIDFVLAGTARTVPHTEWLQYISPLYYYQINKPLIIGYPNYPYAAVILIVIALLLCIVSVWLFTTRDIGGSPLTQQSGQSATQPALNKGAVLRQALRDPATWSVSLHTLRAQATPMLWWIVSILLYGAYGTYITPQLLKPVENLVKNNPLLVQLFSGHDTTTNAGFINYIIFFFMPLVILIYGMVQALTWSSALDTGRMELVLGTPHGRARIQSEHLIVVIMQLILTPILLWLTIMLSALAINISVDSAHVAAASLSILPMSLVIIGIVYACAGRLRNTTIMFITTFYLVAAFMVEWVYTLLKLPEWVLSLSLFHAYGNPMVDGWQWTPNIVMVIVAIVLLGIGFVQFHSANVDKGNV